MKHQLPLASSIAGVSIDTVNKDIGMSCSGMVASAMLPPAVKHQLPVMPFDCSGQSTNAVNKGTGVCCFGDNGTCEAATGCETLATRDTFDCCGQSTNTVNKALVCLAQGTVALALLLPAVKH